MSRSPSIPKSRESILGAAQIKNNVSTRSNFDEPRKPEGKGGESIVMDFGTCKSERDIIFILLMLLCEVSYRKTMQA